MQSLTPYFSASVARRGREYADSDLVDLTATTDDGTIVALVEGTNDYCVTIVPTGAGRQRELLATCDCPYASDGTALCKHIYATLCAVEGRPEARLLEGAVRIRPAASTISDGFDVDDDDDDFGHAPVPRRRGAARWPRLAAPPPPPPPPWQAALSQLRRTAHLANPKAPQALTPCYVLQPSHYTGVEPFTVGLLQVRSDQAGPLCYGARPLAVKPEDILRIPTVEDRMLCLMFLAARTGGSYYHYNLERNATSWTVPAGARPEIVPQLCSTGRFFVYRIVGGYDPTPLRWDDAGPWELAVTLTADGTDGAYRLGACLRRGAERLPLNEVERVFDDEPTLFLRGQTLGLARLGGCHEWVETLRGGTPLRVRRDERERFLNELKAVGSFPPIEWPPEWGVTTVEAAAPHPALRVRAGGAGASTRPKVAAALSFRYGETTISSADQPRALVDPAAARITFRNLEAEATLRARLAELGLKSRYGPFEFELHAKHLPRVVAALLADEWEVMGQKQLYRSAGQVRVEFKSGIDWFELHGAVDFGDQSASLPQVLAAARRGEQFVALGDGSLGLLPERWLAQHGALLDLGQAGDESLRFERSQVGVVDALLAALPEARFDRVVAEARRKLARFSGVAPRPAPAGFDGELRPYQKAGLGWLAFLDEMGLGGCLADDMGLGKTVQVLAHLQHARQSGAAGPSLVVAPRSLVFNWMREAQRFTPGLRLLDYSGLERRAAAARLAAADLVLTTYGTLRRDVAALSEVAFDYVILDEAQAIKNAASLSAKSVRLLRGRRRLVLTGTPIENSLSDLWSLMEFLNPGMLGTLRGFRRAGAARDGDGGTGEVVAESLRRMLRPVILRRTKEQVAPELPPRIEQTIECELAPEQAKLYAELRDYYRKKLLPQVRRGGVKRHAIHVLEALLRLRQAACHVGLVDAKRRGTPSAKLETLLDRIDELLAEKHKALVFSQFTSLLALLREQLDARGIAYEYLDGQTVDRAARVDRFQNDAALPLFLISLKAGGVGLNLTAADYVFILDPWWNPAVEAQAIDRTHRIGQDKRVIACRLIARGTVESKILELQQSKRDLAAAIINEQNSVLETLTSEELEQLLS